MHYVRYLLCVLLMSGMGYVEPVSSKEHKTFPPYHQLAKKNNKKSPKKNKTKKNKTKKNKTKDSKKDNNPQKNKNIAPESALAHQFLDGLRGIEIGAVAHNPFGLNTLNIDYTDDYTTGFKQGEINQCGTFAKVDIVAPGDKLPFVDNSWDFVISSHVIEHFYDPIRTIKEWFRVVKPGGYVYIIAPHKERTFDKDRPRTLVAEIVDRHLNPNPPEVDHHGHYSVWITEDFVDICHYMGWDVVAVQNVDDKVGNGFTVVLKKH